jgi:uncharacterized protein YcnI
MHSKTTKITIGAIAGLALAFGAPLAASAHVTVSPDQADAGSYALLAFRVPTESETAGTVGLAVDLPQDTPFAYVSTEPIPGWTAEIVQGTLAEPVDVDGAEVTEAATRVVWTADPGVQVAPGEFQRFTVIVGPVPDTGSVALPATQTYSDGEVGTRPRQTPSTRRPCWPSVTRPLRTTTGTQPPRATTRLQTLTPRPPHRPLGMTAWHADSESPVWSSAPSAPCSAPTRRSDVAAPRPDRG